MDNFIEYIHSKSKGELVEELKELYSSFEAVRTHYSLKSKDKKFDPKIIKKYETKISEALNLDGNWQGGFNIDKVDNILSRLNSKSNHKYYIELGIYSINECTELANAYGGDYGDEFYLYFIELYQNVNALIWEEGLENEYQMRLRILMEESFEGYGYQDELRDVYYNYFQEEE